VGGIQVCLRKIGPKTGLTFPRFARNPQKIRHILRGKKKKEKRVDNITIFRPIDSCLSHIDSAFYFIFKILFIYLFFTQFCDVVTMAIIPYQVDLATCGYRPAKKVKMY